VCLVAPNVALFPLSIADRVRCRLHPFPLDLNVVASFLFCFFVFFDCRLHNGDNAEIKKYFVSFWNGVDLRYKLLKGPKVRISIAGIIISRVRLPSSYNLFIYFFFPASFLQMVIECVHRDEMRLLTLRKIVSDGTPSTRQPL
jgi:glucan phosphoethanolaminetransferase (alkaline phosphatase superfamily)